MAKILKLVVLVPVAVVLVAFAIANRQIVSVSLDPFADPSASTAVVTAPLFVVLFLVLIVGTFLGGVATWVTQGSHRRRARQAEDDAAQWRDQVRRMHEAPPIAVPATGRALARPGL